MEALVWEGVTGVSVLERSLGGGGRKKVQSVK